MAEKVTAAEAKTNLSSLLAKVLHEHRRFVIVRRGKPVAALVSIEELEHLEADGPVPRMGLLAAIEEMKTLPEVPADEIDDMVQGIYERRARSSPRIPNLEGD